MRRWRRCNDKDTNISVRARIIILCSICRTLTIFIELCESAKSLTMYFGVCFCSCLPLSSVSPLYSTCLNIISSHVSNFVWESQIDS